jgi:hypothetical protein
MRALWIVLLAGCSAGRKPGAMRSADPWLSAHAAEMFVQATNRGDAAAIEAMLDEPFQLDGVWFEDPSCREFATPARLRADKFPALAKCLATLRLQPSGRNSVLSTAALVTYEPGIELELRFFAFDTSSWLHSIGPVSYEEQKPSIPTISPALLDSLRTTRDAPDPSTTVRLAAELAGRDYVSAWLKVCVDVRGDVTVESRDATSELVGDVFSNVAKTWKFSPVVLGGQPSPACSFVRLVYPAGKGPAAQDIPIPIRTPSLAEPKALEARRAAGLPNIVPDDLDKSALASTPHNRAKGAFKVCLDSAGNIELVNMLRSTGIPNYDSKIISTISKTWRYTPFTVDGVPKPICTVVVFVYTQH